MFMDSWATVAAYLVVGVALGPVIFWMALDQVSGRYGIDRIDLKANPEALMILMLFMVAWLPALLWVMAMPRDKQ
jgi:hypothetical protein